ncbi:hypothetical protein KQH82_02295 [bacterium]|nr:hypothetical protein [bacterium]
MANTNDNQNQPAGLTQLTSGLTGVSGRTSVFQHRLVPVQILEMEDVLFHLNSAVLMPDRPAGKSSDDGAASTAEQSAVSGLRVLALVFRQFEFDPNLRMIVTGHTDTSGGTRPNFLLSRERSRSVLHLLDGDKSRWCRVCAGHHKVEDYQQIIEYFHHATPPWKRSNWNCDPQGLDDKFGNKTRNAVNGFAQGFNRDYAVPFNKRQLPNNLGDIIANRPSNSWPEADWEAIYDLYSQVLCDTLRILPLELDNRRQTALKFVDDDQKFVGCGESFPLDSQGRDNYRSQQNRRVEILFFQPNDAPVMTCPGAIDRTHEERECPLWSRYHFRPTYIQPGDLHAVAYHLKLQYFNRIKGQTMSLPTGLNVTALDENGAPLPTRVVQGDDLCTVVVQYPTQAKADSTGNKVRFKFEAAGQYVFTANRDAVPRIVSKTADEWNALTAREKLSYYDLPVEFDSLNWFATRDNEVKPIAEHLNSATSAGSPIIVNLDSVVLVDSTGSQVLHDRTAFINPANPNGEPKPLSEKSRVRLLFVDPADNQMKIHPPVDPAAADIPADYEKTLIRFCKDDADKYFNFVATTPGNLRAVVFCTSFYDVTNKRTVRNDRFNAAAGHVLGARAAILNDPDCHVIERVKFDSPIVTVHNSKIGDYALHYLHGGGHDNDKRYSYLVVYWCSFILKDTNPTVGGTGNHRPATDAEVQEFFSVGMVKSMHHWNKKQYQFVSRAAGADHVVRPFYLFEGNETLEYNPPSAFDFTANDYEILFSKAEFNAALRQCRGGRPFSVTFVVEEDKGSWVMSWRQDNTFSLLSLRIKTREDDPGRFAGFPFQEFNDPGGYGCLVMAHELGHATGQVDDYMEKVERPATNGYLPNFAQFGYTNGGDRVRSNNSNFPQRVQTSEGYSIAHDKLTMMDKNGPIRMRHVWRSVHWLNTKARNGQPLYPFLNAAVHEMYYPRADMRYYRRTEDSTDPWRFTHNDRRTINGNKTATLSLFESLDETRRLDRSNTASPTDVKSIVAVRFLLSIAFVDNGAIHWTQAQKRAWATQIYRWLTKADGAYKVENRFKLVGGGGALDPTIIRVIPGFEFYNAGHPPAHGAFNYRIEVKQSSNDAMTLDANRVFTLGDNHAAKKIINFFYNKPADAAALSAADFRFVADWFNQPAISTGGFRVEEV